MSPSFVDFNGNDKRVNKRYSHARDTRNTPASLARWRVFCYVSSFVFRRNNRLPAVWVRDSLAFRISTSVGRVAVRSAIVDRSVLFTTMCYIF